MLPFFFTKMHGLGNDFVLLEGSEEMLTPERVQHIAHRRLGIGCDQIVLLSPHITPQRTVSFWNADGTRTEACGNGTRCAIGWLAHKLNLPPHTPLSLLTDAGLRKGWVTAPGQAAVEQGTPQLIFKKPLDLSSFGLPPGWAVSVGNPHLVIFVDDVAAVPVATLGAALEHHPAFPHRTNVEFVQHCGDHIRMRVWERGAGETQACGTGACASAFLALHHGHFKGPTLPVVMQGGTLKITWQKDQPLLQEGAFVQVYEGTGLF